MSKIYEENYERKIVELANNRVETGNFKVFDDRARIITRRQVPKHSGERKYLIIANSEGETIAITPEFEFTLRNALRIEK